MSPLVIAVAKGYLWTAYQECLAAQGIELDPKDTDSRKLSVRDRSGNFEFLIVRSTDVPVYVQEGAADLGIVGQDVLAENPADVIDLFPLPFAGCRLVLAALKGAAKTVPQNARVATKYIHLTQRYFYEHNTKITPIKLYGAIELAPSRGLSDYVTDLVVTGNTLKENGLVELETIFTSTATLIANPMSLKSKYTDISSYYTQLREHYAS